MSCSFGDKFKVTVFGQSHSEAIGVVIDGVPAGVRLDEAQIAAFLQRRAPGNAAFATQRKESDRPQIVSGVVDGVTCGAPVCALILNGDAHSKDYDALRACPRPSHADYAAFLKYGAAHDIRGGGNFSGRMTAPLCFAGALAMQLLEAKGVTVGAHIRRIGFVQDMPYDGILLDRQTLCGIKAKAFPVQNDSAGEEMCRVIEQARLQADSVGGVVECAVLGVPGGVGGPIFDSVESVISHLVFSIPGVKAVAFGNGFDCVNLRGSENNDPFCFEDGEIRTESNRHGGVLGGLTSGMPILFTAAFKPTPSIGQPQRTVNLQTGENTVLTVEGRHDPCIVPRAVPCVEAAAAIALMNLL
ncbi:MAG: chorismate synthase [Clostridia bacterium]|nr:chorismate synthase [Clostridia bacterium]MBR3552539.1 chorismate synthase [Clostridia bacterium]